jgi:hypothetical protein
MGYAAGMVLELDPSDLDGRPVSKLAPLRTTIGITVNTPDWNGRTRIIPGSPGISLLYQLIANRGMGNQMPPSTSSEVDVEHVALVEAWIRRMPPVPIAVEGAAPAERVDAAALAAAIRPPDGAAPGAVSAPPDAEPPPPVDAIDP